MDPLSDVLSLLKPRSYVSGGYMAGSHFVLTGSHAAVLLRSLPPVVHIRKESDDSISVIAAALGYESESAFGKAFKRVVGCSPKQHSRGGGVARKIWSAGRV